MGRNDKERARRAREAYERAQQEAGRLAMEPRQVEDARDDPRLERIAQNERRLSEARDVALASMDANGLPDNIVRLGSGGHGWLLHSASYGSKTHSGEYWSEDKFYLAADGAFEWHFSHKPEDKAVISVPIGNEGSVRVTPGQIAEKGQDVVDGVIDGLHQLTSTSPIPIWPYYGE